MLLGMLGVKQLPSDRKFPSGGSDFRPGGGSIYIILPYNSCGFQPIGWDHPCRFVVQRNKAYFQIVLLSYDLWRYIVGFAQAKDQENTHQPTIHAARLKLLFLASKIIRGGNRMKILYSS